MAGPDRCPWESTQQNDRFLVVRPARFGGSRRCEGGCPRSAGRPRTPTSLVRAALLRHRPLPRAGEASDDRAMHAQPQPSYRHGTSTTSLLGETIGANLERTCAAFGDREALVDLP